MKVLNYLPTYFKQCLLVMILTISSLSMYGQSCSANFTHQYMGSFDGSFSYSFTGDSSNTDSTLMYSWSFGDGYSGTGFSTSHQFPSGSYWIHLYVNKLDSSCHAHDSAYIVISDSMCHADFTYTHDSMGNYHFTKTSNGNVFYWAVLYGYTLHHYTTDSTLTYTDHFSPGTYTVCLAISDSNCWDSTCKIISVPGTPSCNADFTYSVDTLTGYVHFTNTSTTGNDSATYQWVFWGVSGSSATNPVYHFNPGTYKIILYLYGDNCWDSISKMITVPGVPCTANFTYNLDSLTGETHFSNTSTGNDSVVYYWYFGDGSSSSAENPVHTFAPGTYTVLLYMSGNNCWDSLTKVITIPNRGCYADFSYTMNNDSPGVVHFINLSGTGHYYQWYFGNGATSTTYSPSVYFSPGTYTVCLLVEDSACLDTMCQVIHIGNDTMPCHADFTYYVDTLKGAVYFMNTSTSGDSTVYDWYFGNGDHSSDENPLEYYAPGTYWVCMLLSGENCWDSACTLITIPAVSGCYASFTYSVTNYNDSIFMVAFDNLSDTGHYYQWSLGDGNSSTQFSPVHYYLAGTYTVCLMVEDSGCVDTMCQVIELGNDTACAGDFTYYVDTLTGQVYFMNTSITHDSTLYAWRFGNGTFSSDENPTQLFNPGTYTVCLGITSIWRGGWCSDSVCKEVIVPGPCDANFTFALYPDSADGVRRIVLFENLSTGLNLDYYWNFGDSTTSTYGSPVHYYDVNGDYMVCLIVTGDSCIDSVCKVVHISDTDSITGLASLGAFDHVAVYPVPFSDYLNIDLQSHTNEKMNIKIYDILGVLRHEENRLVSTGKNQISVHLDKLNQGIYFIELSTHEKTTSLKIIK